MMDYNKKIENEEICKSNLIEKLTNLENKNDILNEKYQVEKNLINIDTKILIKLLKKMFVLSALTVFLGPITFSFLLGSIPATIAAVTAGGIIITSAIIVNVSHNKLLNEQINPYGYKNKYELYNSYEKNKEEIMKNENEIINIQMLIDERDLKIKEYKTKMESSNNIEIFFGNITEEEKEKIKVLKKEEL